MQKRLTDYANLNRMSEKELTRWIESSAKRNNQRLRELEKKGLDKSSAAHRYVKRQAYDGAAGVTYDRQGRVKFKTSQKGMTFIEKKAYAFELANFEHAKSSTIKGMHEINAKSEETFNQNWGDSGVSYADFAEAMSVDIMKKIYDMFGSDVAVEVTERSKGLTADEIAEALGDYESKSVSEILTALDAFQQSKNSMDNEGGVAFADDVPM